MEEMRNSLTSLTGAVNSILQQLKTFEGRIGQIERRTDIANLAQRLTQIEQERPHETSTETPVSTLQVPQTEEDLKSICRIPDSVKELRTFDGNPLQYVSWVHAVEMVLKDFEIVKNKPIYRTIMQSIRQKVVDKADAALVSYNVFDADWKDVKRILSLHYADKRDVQTLEHQLNQLSQGSSKVDEFYSTINQQLSLIINKLKTESYSEETVNALIATHRNRALDIFIRGLTPELSKMVIIQRPRTLPEAYSACLELQNLTMRNNILHTRAQTRNNDQRYSQPRGAAPPRLDRPYHYNHSPNNSGNNSWQRRNNNNHNGNYNPNYRPVPFPRAPQIKQEPMEVDRSIQTKRVDYMNRPKQGEKRSGSEIFNKEKQQRLYHLNTSDVCPQDYSQNCYEDYALDHTDQYPQDYQSDHPQEEDKPDGEIGPGNEGNFMEEGHQACLT